MITTRTTYESNVSGLTKDLNERLERAVARAAKDGARWAESRSGGVAFTAEPVEDNQVGVLSSKVSASRNDFQAIMLDKGTLGQRKLALKYPNKRKGSWKVRRKVKGAKREVTSGGREVTVSREFTAHRSADALARGGIRPRYFMVRGKRYGQAKLQQYVSRAL